MNLAAMGLAKQRLYWKLSAVPKATGRLMAYFAHAERLRLTDTCSARMAIDVLLQVVLRMILQQISLL